MKGRLPDLGNVIPMRGDALRPAPDAPEFLRETARQVWEELAGGLAAKGRLEPAYVYQFAAYCEACASFIESVAVLACEGYYYETTTRNGLQQKKRAMWGVHQDAVATMTRLSALFGLSPVDEARLKVTGQGDLFSDLMKQLKGGDGSA